MPATTHAAPHNGPIRVLVVEDNHDCAETLRLYLEFKGFEVTVAGTGTDGVARALAERPDIVLCDIGLPLMDGYAVAQTLRADPATRSARLIAVTGYGNEEARARSMEAGFDLHLVKPIDLSRLTDHLALPIAS